MILILLSFFIYFVILVLWFGVMVINDILSCLIQTLNFFKVLFILLGLDLFQSLYFYLQILNFIQKLILVSFMTFSILLNVNACLLHVGLKFISVILRLLQHLFVINHISLHVIDALYSITGHVILPRLSRLMQWLWFSNVQFQLRTLLGPLLAQNSRKYSVETLPPALPSSQSSSLHLILRHSFQCFV